MPEMKQNPYAPTIGEKIEVPSADLTLGGRKVTVHPMTMKSLESLVVVLEGPLKVLAEELISRPEIAAGDVTSETMAGMAGVMGSLWRKHVVSALTGAPKLLRQTVSVMINLDDNSPIVEVASVAEIWASWSQLNELNDFSAIGKQIAGLFQNLVGQYAQRAVVEAQAESIVDQVAESGSAHEAVLKLVQDGPQVAQDNEVPEEPAE